MNTFMLCSGDGSILTYPSYTCLTFAIVGIILILMSILTNIIYVVYVKCSQRSGYNSICWNDVKPINYNTFLGFLFGFSGFVFVLVPLFISLIFGIYKFLITL